MSIGFAEKQIDPLERLRRAYRLCLQATNDLERCRAESRPRERAEYFGRAVVDVRNIQAEVEAAGRQLKNSVIIDSKLTDAY